MQKQFTITQMRKIKGISQQELANKLGISASAISRREQKKAKWRINEVVKFCEVLNVDIKDLKLEA